MLDDGKISKTAYENALGEVMALDRPEALAKNDYVETYTYYCAARALMETEDSSLNISFPRKMKKTNMTKLMRRCTVSVRKSCILRATGSIRHLTELTAGTARIR